MTSIDTLHAIRVGAQPSTEGEEWDNRRPKSFVDLILQYNMDEYLRWLGRPGVGS